MRWKCVVAYDGTDFEGWQSQVTGRAIQDVIERRLEFLLEKPTRIFCAGRTDSGVHARGQVFHFDGEWKHPVEYLHRALRSNIPESIQILSVEAAPDHFNALTSATGKRYAYYMVEGQASPFETRYCWSLGKMRVDDEAMRAAAAHLVGRHNFLAFAGNPGRDGDPNPVKHLRRLDVQRVGPRVTVVTEGSGYLYKMVRSLVGALVEVGRGNLPVNEIPIILASQVRTARVVTAPARGLFLEQVFYGDGPPDDVKEEEPELE